MKYPEGPGVVSNRYQEGDPGTGVDATTLRAVDMNALTYEIINVIIAAGIVLDGEDEAQLLQSLQALFEPKYFNNDAAVTDPTVNDDSGDGYAVGSRWINTSSGEMFRCLNATAGAAVWVKTTLTLDELGALAVQDTINNDDWNGAALAVANGGTGSNTGVGALANLGAYGGEVSSAGAAVSLPAGWSVTRLGVGQYKVTHNFGSAAYAPDAAGTNSVLTVLEREINHFTLIARSLSATNVDDDFYFTVVKYG